MAVSYATNKKSIYNWREKNADKNREVNRRAQKRFREWKSIQKIYFQILL